jgi:hypothetical protein
LCVSCSLHPRSHQSTCTSVYSSLI